MDVKSKSSQKKLDSEFRRILQIIKPYIPSIMDNYALSRYRLWLEKLSNVDESEKKERNLYLIELSRQIEAGILEPPFKDEPPVGQLIPFSQCICYFQASTNAQPLKSSIYQQIETKVQQKDVNYQQSQQNELNYCQPQSQHFYHQSQNLPQNCQQENYICQDDSMQGHYQAYQKNLQNFYVHGIESTIQHPFRDQQNNKKMLKKRNNHIRKNLHEEIKPQENYLPYPKQNDTGVIYLTAQHDAEIKQKFKTNEWADTEDSSWCDLTEVSTTMTLPGSGDSGATPQYNQPNDEIHEICDKKINKLTKVIQNLQLENAQLRQQVERCEKDLCLPFSGNTKAETSIHNLAGEVQGLKSRLQELIEIKTALKDKTQHLSVNWKSKYDRLQKEFFEARHKPNDSDAIITNLENKLKEIEINHQKEKALMKAKISELHEKEIVMLNQVHLQNIKSLENSFNQKMVERENNFDEKIGEMRVNYESRISHYESTIKEKDAEISRLEDLVEKQCSRMQKEVHTIRTQFEDNTSNKNEGYIDKIIFLQKCIAKMDKLYQKAERDYLKQVTKLRREIEIRDKSRQIQLTTQRAELLANNSSQRQNEVDSVIKSLEERYKALMENQQQQTHTGKDNDDKTVEAFKNHCRT